MNPKLLAVHGLKFDPFSPEVPIEAPYLSPKIENYCWRIEQAHLREGGRALIHVPAVMHLHPSAGRRNAKCFTERPAADSLRFGRIKTGRAPG